MRSARYARWPYASLIFLVRSYLRQMQVLTNQLTNLATQRKEKKRKKQYVNIIKNKQKISLLLGSVIITYFWRGGPVWLCWLIVCPLTENVLRTEHRVQSTEYLGPNYQTPVQQIIIMFYPISPLGLCPAKWTRKLFQINPKSLRSIE